MKKFTTFETQLGESVELTDKAKLSLYKKSQNSGYSVDILEEVYRRGYNCWTEAFGGNPDSFAFDRVNSFIAGGFAEMLDEDLKKACWKGYEAVGMKKKNGKTVPNCVPVKEQLNAPLPPVETIADKFDKPVSTIKRVIKTGAKVEKEHTKNQKTAEKIATAHVNERPDYYKKLNKAGLEEQEEKRSKNPDEPASRFIGSDELVTIYKSQTPGQVIKKVVKENLNEKFGETYMSQGRQFLKVKRAKQKAAKTPQLSKEELRKQAEQLSKGVEVKRVNEIVASVVNKWPTSKNIEDNRSTTGGDWESKIYHGASLASQAFSNIKNKISPPEKPNMNPKAEPLPGGKAIVAKDGGSTGTGVQKDNEMSIKNVGTAKNDYLTSTSISGGDRKSPTTPSNMSYTPTPGSGTSTPTTPRQAPAKEPAEVIDAADGSIFRRRIKEAIAEATYQGKKVTLNKPMAGDVKKSKVFVDPDGDGKAQKVNFGDKNMSIKKDQPARKKSYCARSGGQGNLTDKTSANYWSRRAWNCEEFEGEQ